MNPNPMDYTLPPTLEISVIWGGVTIPLFVPLAARIMEVKLLISESLGVPIPPERQELSWQGQFLSDELTMQSYQIPPNAAVTVSQRIQVSIDLGMAGRFHVSTEYLVHDSTTVGELKAKLGTNEKVEVENKVLKMGDSVLHDGVQLSAAGVKEGSVLHLVDPMQN